MELIKTLLLALIGISGVVIIILVLLQKGKGAEAGATFGGSSTSNSSSFFGAAGAANFLSRTTAIFATIFFISALGLNYISNKDSKSLGVFDEVDTTINSSPIPDSLNPDDSQNEKNQESSTQE